MNPTPVGGCACDVNAAIQAIAFWSAHPGVPVSTIMQVKPFVPFTSTCMVPSRFIWTIVAPFTTSLQPGEILTEVRVRDASVRAGGAYLKLERKVGDFATVGVAVHLQMDDGKVKSAGA